MPPLLMLVSWLIGMFPVPSSVSTTPSRLVSWLLSSIVPLFVADRMAPSSSSEL